MIKILIVEDNSFNADMLRRRFENKNFKVFTEVDGESAIVTAEKKMPSIILMDLELPGIDGWETTKLIKVNPNTKHIPIIALTAFALSGEKEKALKIGCDDFVTKPINFDQLLEKIEKLT